MLLHWHKQLMHHAYWEHISFVQFQGCGVRGILKSQKIPNHEILGALQLSWCEKACFSSHPLGAIRTDHWKAKVRCLPYPGASIFTTWHQPMQKAYYSTYIWTEPCSLLAFLAFVFIHIWQSHNIQSMCNTQFKQHPGTCSMLGRHLWLSLTEKALSFNVAFTMAVPVLIGSTTMLLPREPCWPKQQCNKF